MKGSLGNPKLYFYGIIVKTPFWNEGRGGEGRGGEGGPFRSNPKSSTLHLNEVK